MRSDIMNKTILKAAGIAVFTVAFCKGCYDLGIEPGVQTPTVETFVDIRDGKEYKKVKIGEQVWMAENLKYADDNSICYSDGWSGRDPAKNCAEYGRLYDWNTAMNGEHSSNSDPSGVEGICPVGWHLPSDAEWKKLIDYVGEHAGTKLKSKTFLGSQPGSVKTPDGTDIYNFSALLYGSRWWSSTETDSHSDEAWVRVIYDTQTYVFRGHFEKHLFLSVRCVHD